MLRDIAEFSRRLIINKFSYTARALFLGMLIAQILATIQVYLSNVSLYNKVLAIKDAGYLAIPNQHIMQTLQGFGPAFFGGLFFTLSVGAGLSLSGIAAAWIWDRLLSRKKIYLIPFLLLLAGCLVGVNLRGFCPVVTSYFLVIPVIVFVAVLKWMPTQHEKRAGLMEIAHFVPILLLAFLWISQMQSHMFIDIRDNLLLSNPLGRKINDFYYKYTLYPAEVFKTLHQKTLKTCSMEQIKQERVARVLRNKLINSDYLEAGEYNRVDLKITKDADSLILINKGKIILKSSIKDFLAGQVKVLKQFSLKTDKHGFFRKFTILSLMAAFPISLYILFFSLFRFVLSFFQSIKTASAVASILCFIGGIGLFIPFYYGVGNGVNVKNLSGALESEHRHERVAALKILYQRRMEIGNFQAYQRMLKSSYVPELYWLVRALSISRKPETYKDLPAFLDNPHPNIVCMAFYALGRRGDKSAVKKILEKIETSDHWYCQWYAYKALRTLGWKQIKLK